MGTRAAAALVLGVWAGSALAQTAPIAVAVPDGRLVPGATHLLEVGVAGAIDPPEVSSTVGPVRRTRQVATGVWEYALAVPADALEVRLGVQVDSVPWEWPLQVWIPPESSLELPTRIEGVARGEAVSFDVRGEDLPPPEALQVVVGEGRVTRIEAVEGAVRITVQPDDSPFPRYIPVGVRDGRTAERPTWGGIRLRTRATLPLESEPGSTVSLFVGDRSYGPVQVGADGRAQIKIDQFPEEVVATAIFVDDLGNETRTEIPLARQIQAQLVAFPSGDIVPGAAPPLLYLTGIQANGFPWRDRAPSCRTAAADLQVRPLSRGQWLVALPGGREGDLEDLRVDCDLGDAASVRTRVPVARGIPARLGLRVWPTDLRTDFPFAEVRVVLEDHRSDRLGVDGVRVWAEHGSVVATGGGPTEIQAEYDGSQSTEHPQDVVHASYAPTPSDGFADSVELGWETVPRTGEVELRARVVDPERRPVAGVEVQLDAGSGPIGAVTDPAGVAHARAAVPNGAMPVVLSAQVNGRRAEAVALRGRVGRPLAEAALAASSDLLLRPGRVAGLSVQVDPQVLRAAPGALAWVYVNVEDHAGNPIGDEVVRLTATEGFVGALRPRADGTLVAQYIPATSDRPRDVEITAEIDTLRSTTRLSIAPRPVRLTLGAWGGVQTNFGAVTAPVFGVDADLRVRSRLTGESLMLRLGVARYRFSSTASTGSGPDARLTASVYPTTAAALLRRDQGIFGAWAGAGLALAVQDLQVDFGSQSVGRGLRLVAGPTLVSGAGARAFGGEVLLTLQVSWLPIDAGDVGFSGNIGGLATGLGYRLVF